MHGAGFLPLGAAEILFAYLVYVVPTTRSTPVHPRGVYVYGGTIVLVIRYNKATRKNNREFQVARFLPVGAAEILFTYLVYVVPFSDMLRRQCLQTTATPSTFLFGNPFRPHETLATSGLTKVLRNLSRNVLGTPIGVKIFRQLSIAITERHVKERLKPFNRHQDRRADANPASVFAWQSDHRPFARSNTYGLDGAFPDSLQPSLLQL